MKTDYIDEVDRLRAKKFCVLTDFDRVEREERELGKNKTIIQATHYAIKSTRTYENGMITAGRISYAVAIGKAPEDDDDDLMMGEIASLPPLTISL